MSANFIIANSSRLLTTKCVYTLLPYTWAFWGYINATNATWQKVLCCTSATNKNEVFIDGTANWGIASAGNNQTNTAVITGQWTFVISRFIGIANRRQSILSPGGAITHSTNTFSVADTARVILSIGASTVSSGGTPAEWVNGRVAEFWGTNTDVGFDSASDLPNTLVRQLAYGGPFSVPRVANTVAEYHSFLQVLGSDSETSLDPYYRSTRATYVPTAMTLGQHPPLPSSYNEYQELPQKLIV